MALESGRKSPRFGQTSKLRSCARAGAHCADAHTCLARAGPIKSFMSQNTCKNTAPFVYTVCVHRKNRLTVCFHFFLLIVIQLLSNISVLRPLIALRRLIYVMFYLCFIAS